MLGFAPLSAAPISGAVFSLVSIPAEMSATGGITFGGSARIGAFQPMSARGGLSFGGSPNLFVNQAISASGGITFGGHPVLRVAGKPLIFTAIPMSFTFRAPPESYKFKAASEQFTFRGVR